MMQLMFCGATETVTGSKYLLSFKGKKILIDCGLFQGYKELRLRNWAKMPFEPKEIDAVLITHAHIDHTGYLPLLVKNGYSGPIYATQATIDLCGILLPDSGYLQELDAERANRYHYSKHHPALALYTKDDAIAALKQFVAVDFSHPQSIFSELKAIWHRAGHILGAAAIEINAENLKIVFTGDMGRMDDPIMKSPDIITDADYLITESTYGDHLHDKENVKNALAAAIVKTVKQGGTILIPAFAVGRAQTILYYLSVLRNENKISNDIPIYLDSPMAINATEIMLRHHAELKISESMCAEVCGIAKYVNTTDESKELDEKPFPKIIISASGMATGGRVLHHLKVFMGDSRNTILFTGYQAGGTRGHRIINGEKEVKIHGEMFPVRASVENITALSAHADYEDMLKWFSYFKKPPKHTFITHGEKESSLHFKQLLEEKFHWSCSVPQYLDVEPIF